MAGGGVTGGVFNHVSDSHAPGRSDTGPAHTADLGVRGPPRAPTTRFRQKRAASGSEGSGCSVPGGRGSAVALPCARVGVPVAGVTQHTEPVPRAAGAQCRARRAPSRRPRGASQDGGHLPRTDVPTSSPGGSRSPDQGPGRRAAGTRGRGAGALASWALGAAVRGPRSSPSAADWTEPETRAADPEQSSALDPGEGGHTAGTHGGRGHPAETAPPPRGPAPTSLPASPPAALAVPEVHAVEQHQREGEEAQPHRGSGRGLPAGRGGGSGGSGRVGSSQPGAVSIALGPGQEAGRRRWRRELGGRIVNQQPRWSERDPDPAGRGLAQVPASARWVSVPLVSSPTVRRSEAECARSPGLRYK